MRSPPGQWRPWWCSRPAVVAAPSAAADVAIPRRRRLHHGARRHGPATATATTHVTEEERQEAMLAFAQCMRDHGVDMPDPEFDGDGRGVRGAIRVGGDERPRSGGLRSGPDGLRGPPRGRAGSFGVDDPEQRAEMQEQLLAFSQCIRDHGIDMPDPQFRRGRRVDDPGRPGWRHRPGRHRLPGRRGGLPGRHARLPAPIRASRRGRVSRRAVVAGTAGLLLVAAGGVARREPGQWRRRRRLAAGHDGPGEDRRRWNGVTSSRPRRSTDASATATASRSPGTAAW